MPSNTLFEPPAGFTKRIADLQELGVRESRLLLQVELGFALMEKLGLDDEPVTAVWAILSGMFIKYPELQNLRAEDRRAIANVRQIVPFSARFNWLNALRDYKRRIPEDWRNYDFDLQDLDNQTICGAKNLQQQANQCICESCLTATLNYRRRERDRVQAGTYYQFESETKEETVRLQVKFTQAQVGTTYPLPWFNGVRERSPVAVNLADLEAEAIFLDNREEALAQQYSWQNTAKGNWVKRFNKLNYHKVLAGNIVEQEPAHTLNIDGFTHVPGMVAAGKSTLSLLLSSDVIRNHPKRRITIVVGDTQSAIKIANQINWWFCDDPETDDPVAVPILGPTQRDKHLQGFSDSDDYLAHFERGQPHWGERWLSVICPLQAGISQIDRNNILNGKPLKPGSEPCHSLRKAPEDKTKTATGKAYFCPLFDRCPSQQVYRDMPKARVWITTPGAMAYGGMPYHYELRPIKMGELVYEQSDILVFDEVDTIIEWFDKVYAEQVTLTYRSRNGVFDEIGVKTELSNRANVVRSPVKLRWSAVQRNAQTAINTTLTLLSDELGQEVLQKWVQQGYFTPHVLFYKLARRLAGLEEFDSYPRSEEQLRINDRDIQSIMDYFDDFLKDDPVITRNSSNLATTRLLEIVQRINNTGESAIDEDIFDDCRNWIISCFPDTQSQLNRLMTELNNLRNQPNAKDLYPYLTEEEDIDTLETLATRLQFSLTITLLDRHTKIVFYEWQNRPDNIRETSPHRRMPSAMTNILPLPVTGRQFGTYYSRKNSNTLSLFAYTNIGRDYVLNYHRLLTDFDGQRGPNVLALSGTSYLPESTTFHVGDSQGILMPEASAQEAIKQSEFKFIPQFDHRNKPIRVSGSLSNKKQPNAKFTQIAKSLVTDSGSNHLIEELQKLQELGETNPELWHDRDRILVLVNSYEQAKWVADEMRSYCPSMRLQINHLVNDELEPTKDGKSQPGELKRPDIEIFGHNRGKILVAPTTSIGRGFNILNRNGKAAFGAVYFLTRPYPHPNDTQAIAQEMNRRAYQWLEKEDFIAWQQGDGIAHRAELLRKTANTYWRSIEQRSYYKTLRDNEDLCSFPRYDIAATTLGRIIQAVGRLIRGGVPFHGYFVDSAWADNSAKKLAAIRAGEDADAIDNDTEENSLLVAIIRRVWYYVDQDSSVGNALYKPLADAFENIEDVYF
ncbi:MULTISPECIES: pPIWI_RE_Z domain-containing protein [unclassified Microcoleus]|uniref:pPIWI_RE_Z domain-containing protein n=1 Tax=unclassified Microcoleus TaxID=2642155 RepID=UPI002FD503EB